MACARLGLSTLLLTSNADRIGHLSCNPAIGGTAKGHLVREVDALGGMMGLWADEAGIRHARILSDHRDAALGAACGVLIRELRLLARAVFVAGAGGRLGYVQVVPEITHEPDYDAALAAAKALL